MGALLDGGEARVDKLNSIRYNNIIWRCYIIL